MIIAITDRERKSNRERVDQTEKECQRRDIEREIERERERGRGDWVE